MKMNDEQFQQMLERSVVSVVEKDFIETEQATEQYEYTFENDFGDIIEHSSLLSVYKQKGTQRKTLTQKEIRRRIPLKRVVLVAILLTLLLGTTLVLANPDFRESLKEFIISVFSDHVELMENDNKKRTERSSVEKIGLKMVPTEYKLYEITDELPNLYSEIYKDGNNVLIWGIHGKNANMDLKITADGNEPELIQWKGVELWCVTDGIYHTIFYEDNLAIYSLQGNLETSELTQMMVNTLNF